MAVDDAQVLLLRVVLLAVVAKTEAGGELDKVALRVVADRDESVDALEDGGAGLGGRGLRRGREGDQRELSRWKEEGGGGRGGETTCAPSRTC